MTDKPGYIKASRRQRGAALFMSLIFLLILTILGVFGMNISRMENLMAGNAQFQTSALNNAERASSTARNDWQNALVTRPSRSRAWSTRFRQIPTKRLNLWRPESYIPLPI